MERNTVCDCVPGGLSQTRGKGRTLSADCVRGGLSQGRGGDAVLRLLPGWPQPGKGGDAVLRLLPSVASARSRERE